MNYVSETVRDAAVGVAIADEPASLETFLKPGCAAAIWRRQMPTNVQHWLDQCDPSTLPSGRVVLPATAVAQKVRDWCNASGLSSSYERKWLEDDVTALAARFSDLMSAEYLRLRLDVITTNACRKFHIDAITARLVCTFRGTGTQYGISRDGEEPARVFTVNRGAPILLRGTLWPQQPPSGLLHRSPPIEGTGETRLVLVLDPVFDIEGDV